MHYEGNIIRPPSEANAVILQVTVGCSHNACTFCGAYRDKQYRAKEEHFVDADIDFAARYCLRQKTVFLADGNAMALPHEDLCRILEKIRTRLPHVRRVSMYASAGDILARTAAELAELKQLGAGRIYMGLESGHDPTLKAVAKGWGVDDIVAAGKAVRQAGLFLSITVLLGIAGQENSLAHAEATSAALNLMQPNQVAVLTLMILENTPLARQAADGRFGLPGQEDLFEELRVLVSGLELARSQFQANHASNYFTLDGRLPRDKEKFLASIHQAQSGKIALKPESLRAL